MAATNKIPKRGQHHQFTFCVWSMDFPTLQSREQRHTFLTDIKVGSSQWLHFIAQEVLTTDHVLGTEDSAVSITATVPVLIQFLVQI